MAWTKKKILNLKFNMADTCWKNFKVIWVEVQLQKKFFFFKKKTKLTWLETKQGYLKNNQSPITHTCKPKKKNFFLKCFKNISSLPLKSMGKSIYELIYHINVAVIQLQSNLLFQCNMEIGKSYEIVKPRISQSVNPLTQLQHLSLISFLH